MYPLEKIFKQIDQYDIISFDVFDTVLLRPFVKPSNVFDYIEYKYDIKGFSKARKTVVVNTVKEKSIEDIYNNMPSHFFDYLSIELGEEKRLIYPNKKMKEAYLYAIKKKKKIVFISDIYFHSDFLLELLVANGFDKCEKIYSSCDYQKTKCSGELFKQLLVDFNITASQLIHIGDNMVSDDAVPKSLGINTLLIESNFEQYKSYRNYLCEKDYSLWDSFIIKMCADKYANNSYVGTDEDKCWHRFGYEVAGPICWCFVKWIKFIIDSDNSNVSDVAFIARDGYLLKKMFDRLCLDRAVKSHYVLAPRILATLLQESFTSSKDAQKLKQSEVSMINKVYQLDTYTKEERDVFVSKLGMEYENYLNDFNFGDGVIAVVDSTTNNLSSQKLIDYFSNNETCGMYWFASQYAFSLNYKILTCQEERYPVIESEDLFELIFKSPEPAIRHFRIDGTFDYNSINESEKSRIVNFSYMERGAMEFFDDAESHKLKGFPTAQVINKYLIRYCENPDKQDRPIIERGFCCGGIANSIWEPTRVFIDKKKSRSPIAIKKKLKRAIVKHPKLFIFLRKIVHGFQ